LFFKHFPSLYMTFVLISRIFYHNLLIQDRGSMKIKGLEKSVDDPFLEN
jgi:hypothetical protein